MSFLRGFTWHNILLMLYIQQCYLCCVLLQDVQPYFHVYSMTKTRVFYKIYAADGGNSLTFRDDPSIPPSKVKKYLDGSLKLRMCILPCYLRPCGTRWRSWLRHCATNQTVAGSIPDGVTGFFHWHHPSGHTMALGSTQPLTEMWIRNIFWG
jgi:hypothetical protein